MDRLLLAIPAISTASIVVPGKPARRVGPGLREFKTMSAKRQ